jgi:hypothetical protein
MIMMIRECEAKDEEQQPMRIPFQSDAHVRVNIFNAALLARYDA